MLIKEQPLNVALPPFSTCAAPPSCVAELPVKEQPLNVALPPLLWTNTAPPTCARWGGWRLRVGAGERVAGGSCV